MITLNLRWRESEVIRFTFKPEDAALGERLTLVEGIDVEMYIKPRGNVRDTDPRTTLLSTTTGEVTVTDAVNGVCEVAVPASVTRRVDVLYFRVDVVGAGGSPRVPASSGLLIVKKGG